MNLQTFIKLTLENLKLNRVTGSVTFHLIVSPNLYTDVDEIEVIGFVSDKETYQASTIKFTVNIE